MRHLPNWLLHKMFAPVVCTLSHQALAVFTYVLQAITTKGRGLAMRQTHKGSHEFPISNKIAFLVVNQLHVWCVIAHWWWANLVPMQTLPAHKWRKAGWGPGNKATAEQILCKITSCEKAFEVGLTVSSVSTDQLLGVTLISQSLHAHLSRCACTANLGLQNKTANSTWQIRNRNASHNHIEMLLPS